jgi:hypothetical protein
MYHLLFISDTLFLRDDINTCMRCTDFVRQSNNVLCYFKKLSPRVKFSLFQSYCNSFYGCELWSLCNVNVDNISVKWRTALRRIWGYL